MVKNYYNDLFTNTTLHNKCRAIQGNIYELSDFLVNILQFDYFGAELDGRAVYHDSCSGLRECKIKEEPRQLLSKVIGLEMVDLKLGQRTLFAKESGCFCGHAAVVPGLADRQARGG